MTRSANNPKIFSKAFWKSRRGQMTFCAVGMLASVLFLLSQFGINLGGIFPDSGSKSSLERDLKKLQQDQLRLKTELSYLDAVRKVADSKFVGAWKVSENGVPEVELRGMIEKTAKNMELRLNNISTVRKTNFNKDLTLLEVDVSVMTDIDTLMKFLLAVDKLEPRLYWRRFDCRMMNMFGMPGVNFSGTLRCACDERQNEQTDDSAKEKSSRRGK